MLYKACKLLSGKIYQTLSISYIITIGLRHLLKQQSANPQFDIENTSKKYFFDAFLHYFDHKLSIDQKHVMFVSLFVPSSSFKISEYIRLPGKFVQLVSKCISGTFGFCHFIERGFLLRYTSFGPIGSFPSYEKQTF